MLRLIKLWMEHCGRSFLLMKLLRNIEWLSRLHCLSNQCPFLLPSSRNPDFTWALSTPLPLWINNILEGAREGGGEWGTSFRAKEESMPLPEVVREKSWDSGNLAKKGTLLKALEEFLEDALSSEIILSGLRFLKHLTTYPWTDSEVGHWCLLFKPIECCPLFVAQDGCKCRYIPSSPSSPPPSLPLPSLSPFIMHWHFSQRGGYHSEVENPCPQSAYQVE